ncbi:hypothetical protein PPYR_13123 [Photinus pyralis]|uniref:Uncharacterized protein n=1 Tax=Photinus pyralis TaxID=7054 RepID=A0A5N4A848_PHOPY|nr:uncharacterized protein LOC116177857 [Photinus pyralis]KAB0793503.1 hypothetical protein PPYR_13123 [Photinus pyralis]
MFNQLILLICSMVCTSLADDSIFDAIENECIDKLGLGFYENLIVLESGYLKEDDEDMRAFFACVWKEKGFQREDGSVNFNSIYEVIVSERKSGSSEFGSAYVAIQAIANCEDIEEENHGHTVIMVYNCLNEKVLEYDEKFRNKFIR